MGRTSFGVETRRRVISALANLRPFHSAEHSANDHALVGLPGPYRRLTNAKYGALPREYAKGLDDAMYVVYCYGTPIAWVVMADEATEDGRVNFMPDWQYSATTTFHQGVIAEAWGKIHDPNQAKSKRDNAGTARARRSDLLYGRVTAAEVEARREARENRPASFRTAFRDDAARMAPPAEQHSHHSAWRPGELHRTARMDGNNLPEGADIRDAERVRADIDRVLADNDRWHPAHP